MTGTGRAIVSTPAIAHKDPTILPHTPTGLLRRCRQCNVAGDCVEEDTRNENVDNTKRVRKVGSWAGEEKNAKWFVSEWLAPFRSKTYALMLLKCVYLWRMGGLHEGKPRCFEREIGCLRRGMIYRGCVTKTHTRNYMGWRQVTLFMQFVAILHTYCGGIREYKHT